MSNTQSEYELEQALLKQLDGLGYQRVQIANETAMLHNLRQQIEIHNQITDRPLSDVEWKKVISHLNAGNSVFERAKILRDKYSLSRDDGSTKYLRFLNSDDWCRNEFQVTNQVVQHDAAQNTRKTRFDVTILINGLPLVQVELKKRGVELKGAFNQINRYHRDSFWIGSGLYLYTQLFIISNGVNTKYYSNNKNRSFDFTFFWTDPNNNIISDLHQFSAQFLRPCHIAKMITHYTVINEANKCLMVLRPYQFYAVEAMIERVKKSQDHAYIWHTTGSGKTLTSFKASQIIMQMPEVEKVIFVVDRKDLDYQTAREFNAFAKDSVDSTTNTRKLVEQMQHSDKLIVTTIQKLNKAVCSSRFADQIQYLRDKKIVFIFDECHRSQFGETHQNIKKFFHKAQMFGFTGTPIFADNVNTSRGIKQTTESLFIKCLHKYVIVDAIRDANVLRFAVEYVGKYQQKNSKNELDIEVEAIDKTELIESPARIAKIVDYILAQHPHKTKRPDFTAMMCVSSVEMLTRYYEQFKARQAELVQADPQYKPLNIATIFSYAANEAVATEGDDFIAEEAVDTPTGSQINPSSRDKLDSYITDYNATFNTAFSTQDSDSFYNYYKDIAQRVRAGQVDLLLVVNMFLTGFDSPRLNTLYVDKNLKHHGLVQAFSRTNRVLNEKKTQGNIICFRNLKQATDDAIALFSNKDAKSTVLVKPYTEYVQDYQTATTALLALTPTVQSVDHLPDEDAQLAFVTQFRELLRLQNILTTFADYQVEDLALDAQTVEDYTSKYLDLHDRVKRERQTEKVSVLHEVDFELILIHRDEINVGYILKLLKNLKGVSEEERQKRQKDLMDMMSTEVKLRSKRSLVEQFIEQNLPKLDSEDVEQAFELFWDEQRKAAVDQLCQSLNLDQEKMRAAIETYVFENRLPRDTEIADMLRVKPKILERKKVLSHVQEQLKDFIETFIEGMDGLA